MFGGLFANKTVWLSGHTGFKGAWLAQWLLDLGARVRGYALAPASESVLFERLGLARAMHHEVGDVRDAQAVRASMLAAQPDVVFHLAAQPIVRRAYQEPAETYAVNLMGTVHVLDALRELRRPCAAVFITTDKCYLNREWHYGYREDDTLGGHDPYSASKAAAEIAIASFRASYFQQHTVQVASARAGNVIGGGDWAEDRIVPDCIRALQEHRAIAVRNPAAVRPWQHVLEPLSGYLCLAARLMQDAPGGPAAAAFNFGPGPDANRTVGEFVETVLRHWPGRWEDHRDPQAVHEAGLLQLSSDKAHAQLRWHPVWSFETAVAKTVAWYRACATDGGTSARDLTRQDIAQYGSDALARRLEWAGPAAATIRRGTA